MTRVPCDPLPRHPHCGVMYKVPALFRYLLVMYIHQLYTLLMSVVL